MPEAQTAFLRGAANSEEHTRVQQYLPWALSLLAILCASHILYWSQSRIPPSTDEAHYMSGALSIAEGLRSGTWAGAWAGYRGALGFKAPLICIPAGVFMLFTHSLRLPFLLQSVLTFVALALASYSLFRNCLTGVEAITATVLLLASPLITGLTNRYYVELLFLLLSVLLLNLLVRFGWLSIGASILAGLIIGLGVLCKVSFPAYIIAPILFSIAAELIANRRPDHSWLVVGRNVLIAALVAFCVAWPWYASNWQAVVAHARAAASAAGCYYPHWIAIDLSESPSVLTLIAVVVGAPLAFVRIRCGSFQCRSWRALVSIFLLASMTAVLASISVNKATRFVVTWAPLFAVVAVMAFRRMRSHRVAALTMIAFAGIEVLLSLNNAFAIPPLPAVRYGAWRIIDSRFPLNVPDWFDDDAPVDRRKYPNAEVEWRIAADAGTRFPREHMAEARLVQITVTVNFDYFAYLSALRHHPVHYWPWSVDGSTQGANAPDYIVDAPGFDKLYPGAGNATYYPSVASDVALGKIPYIELFRFPGPGTARMVVYVKK